MKLSVSGPLNPPPHLPLPPAAEEEEGGGEGEGEGQGQLHHLPLTSGTVLSSVSRTSNNRSHLASCKSKNRTADGVRRNDPTQTKYLGKLGGGGPNAAVCVCVFPVKHTQCKLLI